MYLNVIILNDDLLGETDDGGDLATIDLSPETYEWTASHISQEVARGRIAFFEFSIAAKGTLSPDIEFDYLIRVSGKQPGTAYIKTMEKRTTASI